MINEKLNIPELRFPGFDGEWKIEPTGNYINLISGYAFKGEEISKDSSGTPILRGINITEGHIRHNSDIDRYFHGDVSLLKKYILKKGDIVLGMDGSKVGKNVALISELDENSILIQRVAKINSNNKSDIKFIFQRIFSPIFHKYVDIVNTSSGIPHISLQQIKDFTVGYPTLPEQQKIASFFTAIDKKISQLKQKKTLLEQYKKGVMQKIFSQKIRFKDANGEEFPKWEKKRLGELDIYISDGNYGELYPRADQMVSQGVPFIRANNIKNLKLSMNDMKFIDGEHHKILTSGHLKTGDILVTTRGEIGMLAYVNEEFNNANINAQICLLRVNFSLNAKYLLNFLSSRWGKVQFKSLQTGSALKQLPKSNLSKILINLPCIQEQTKIANFLSAIDTKINLTQTQIENAELWKKGLLQKMFV